MKLAIHSVFIAKENILFLEEWIDYHIQIGFDVFYLYDNSKVNRKSSWYDIGNALVPGKINRHNINYDEVVKLTSHQVDEILRKIQDKYKDIIYITEWSPLDENGFICYYQEEAHNDCLSKLKQTDVTWCASIDIDEFIVANTTNIKTFLSKIDDNVFAVYMQQQRFQTRFSHLDKNVIEIDKVFIENLDKSHSNKYIYNVNKTIHAKIHSCTGHGNKLHPDVPVISFNHYKIDVHGTNFKIVNNIDPHIKNIISSNSKTYIVKNYTPYPSSKSKSATAS